MMVIDYMLMVKLFFSFFKKGGLKREWLSLICREIFNEKFGLWILSSNRTCYYPNP